VGGLREVEASFVVPGPAGVAIRDRLRLSDADAAVLTEVGVYLGSLAAADLAERSRQGLAHDAAGWAVRKRELTGKSSARWAGSITKATHARVRSRRSPDEDRDRGGRAEGER
jgi:hypothetical protein